MENLHENPKVSVLIVDDDCAIQELIKNAISHLTKSIVLASSGEDAWEIVSHHPDSFDVLITDYKMLKMRGSDLIRRVYQSKSSIKKFIMISSMVGISNDIDLLVGEIPGLLTVSKPFCIADLIAILDT